jgi:hypothetical protein
MNRGEFVGQFTRLCQGFKFEVTDEQTEAWFRRMGHVGIEPWAESVTTLLCAERFPRDLDRVLAVVDLQVRACQAKAILRDRPIADRVSAQIGTVGSGIAPHLFQAIKCCAGRAQVRRNRVNWTKNEEMEPRVKEVSLTRCDKDEARLTQDIIRLMPALPAQDIRRLMEQYEPVCAS